MDFLTKQLSKDIVTYLFVNFYFDEQTILQVRKTNKILRDLLNIKEVKDKICKNIDLFETPKRIINFFQIEKIIKFLRSEEFEQRESIEFEDNNIYTKYGDYFGILKFIFDENSIDVSIKFISFDHNNSEKVILSIKKMNDFDVQTIINKIVHILFELVKAGFQFSECILKNKLPETTGDQNFVHQKKIFYIQALENINIPYLIVRKGDFIVSKHVTFFKNVYQPKFYCKDFFFNVADEIE